MSTTKRSLAEVSILISPYFHPAPYWTAIVCRGLITILMVLVQHGRSAGQEITVHIETEYRIGADLPVIHPAVIVAGLLSDCPSVDLYGIKYSHDHAEGNSTQSGNWEISVPAAISEIAGAFSSAINGNSIPLPIPSVGVCNNVIEHDTLHVSGGFSLYSFGIGSLAPQQRGHAKVSYSDTLSITSAIATEVILPVHLQASAFAAESFGNPVETTGAITASFSGSVNGTSLGGGSLSVESTSVIPEMGAINLSEEVSFSLLPGVNVFGISIQGEFEVIANATPTGFFNTFSGAATAGLTLPNSFAIGSFRGINDTPLPAGIRIESQSTGYVYANTMTTVDGDFDSDGDVDGQDFLQWQRSGLSQTDLDAWTNNYGADLGSVVSIPEPSSKVLVIIELLLLGFCQLRRCGKVV